MMARTRESYDTQFNAEMALHQMESALDLLADNVSDFSPFVCWFDLWLLEKRLKKISDLYPTTKYIPAHPEVLEDNHGR